MHVEQLSHEHFVHGPAVGAFGLQVSPCFFIKPNAFNILRNPHTLLELSWPLLLHTLLLIAPPIPLGHAAPGRRLGVPNCRLFN